MAENQVIFSHYLYPDPGQNPIFARKQRKTNEIESALNQHISKISFSFLSFIYTLFCRKVLCQCFVNKNYFVTLQTKENKVK